MVGRLSEDTHGSGVRSPQMAAWQRGGVEDFHWVKGKCDCSGNPQPRVILKKL
jgi:hypothetical protein